MAAVDEDELGLRTGCLHRGMGTFGLQMRHHAILQTVEEQRRCGARRDMRQRAGLRRNVGRSGRSRISADEQTLR